MKRFHGILSEILLVCMICAIIVPNAMAAEVSNVQTKLNSVLDDFPVGSYFTTDGRRGSPGDLLSILRVHGLSTRGFDQSQTCVGFAKYVWAKIFGHNITAAYRIKIGYGIASVKDTWENAKPGDLIYFNSNSSKPDNCEHAAIVWSVSSTGVTILDCNYNNTNQVSLYTAAFGDNSFWARRYCSVYRANNYDEVGGVVAHVITFNANGGSVSPSTKTVVQGGTLDALPIPTRPGYTFTCWSTAKEGSGAALTQDNYKWLTFDEDTTLYAGWKLNCTNHTYDADVCTNCGVRLPYDNGFNGSAAGTYQVSANTAYIRTGPYQVKDLVSTASQGEFVQVVGSVTNSYNNTWMKTTDGYYVHADKLTLYSKTQDQSYYVILDDGSVCNRIKVTNGGTYGNLPTPTREGYTFDGWYTSAHDGIQVTSTTTVSLANDQTLYAHWTKEEKRIEPSSYFNCDVGIFCVNGKTVNLYDNPGDSVRVDYFSLGQSVGSKCGVNMSDGTTWYQVSVTSKGSVITVWLKYESDKMTIKPISNPGPENNAPKYFNCNVGIFCVNGKIVNLYNNPGDSVRVDYFSLGQSVGSTYGVNMPDGSTWYQVSVTSKGNVITVWLKYESDKMTVRNLG